MTTMIASEPIESWQHQPEAGQRPVIEDVTECGGEYVVIVSAYYCAPWVSVRDELDAEYRDLEVFGFRTFQDEDGEPWDAWELRAPAVTA